MDEGGNLSRRGSVGLSGRRKKNLSPRPLFSPLFRAKHPEVFPAAPRGGRRGGFGIQIYTFEKPKGGTSVPLPRRRGDSSVGHSAQDYFLTGCFGRSKQKKKVDALSVRPHVRASRRGGVCASCPHARGIYLVRFTTDDRTCIFLFPDSRRGPRDSHAGT